jgi:hypothetical protein
MTAYIGRREFIAVLGGAVACPLTGVAADGGEIAQVAITKWRWRRPARNAHGDETE